MYFAYVDESGSPDKKDTHNQIYVLSALIINEKYWDYLHKECKKLKKNIWNIVREKEDPKELPQDFELHMKEISRKERYFKSLKGDDAKWYSVLDKIYKFISKLFIKIITVIIKKDIFYEEYKEGLAKWAFELLVERLNRFVVYNHPDKDQHIMVVMDSVNKDFDEDKRKEIESFMEYGTGHGWTEYPEQVIETPFIVDSKIHNGVQLADAIAFLIRRYAMKYFDITPNAFFNRYCDNLMALLDAKFYRYDSYSLKDHGITFFPRKTSVKEEFWDVYY